MRADTRLPPYLPYPRFLLQADLTQTAKLLYALLLDRATLSQANGWLDEGGRIYLVFPIEKIAAALDRSSMTVKTALSELEDAGLIERRRSGFSKPNRIYVKLPSDGQKSFQVTDRNPSSIEKENCPTDGKKIVPTLTDYTSKVRRHIIAELGDKRMGEVSLDDIQLALVPVSKKSASVYKSVVILYKSIFRAAMESRIIDHNPTIYLTTKGGGVPQEERQALTDEQVERLLDAIRDLPPYVFVMIGLYAGLRREEILALQWDSVYLDTDTPYLTVRRAWHTEHNRPVISDELKTKAAERNIPLPVCLAECLKAAKETSTSEYVVSNRDGEPLSYTQFKRLWQYIVTRTVKERSYYRYEDGKRVKHTVTPVLGEKAAHNGKVVYSLDFEVTPHQLRHTYITNLIHASVDPKTVQYLAGHESSKITMDIYAKVKYNRPDELVRSMNCAFASWDAAQ